MWKAFLFGIVVATTIGPIALLIFGTGASRGIGAGVYAGLGAALADLAYALAAFSTGALVLPYLAAHEVAIQAGSALLLVGLGTWMLSTQLRAGEAPLAQAVPARAFLSVFLLTVVNPLTLLIFAGIVPQLPVAGSLARAAGFALALAAGSAVVNVAIGASGAVLGRALPGDRARRSVSAAAAAGIVAFGLYGISSFV